MEDGVEPTTKRQPSQPTPWRQQHPSPVAASHLGQRRVSPIVAATHPHVYDRRPAADAAATPNTQAVPAPSPHRPVTLRIHMGTPPHPFTPPTTNAHPSAKRHRTRRQWLNQRWVGCDLTLGARRDSNPSTWGISDIPGTCQDSEMAHSSVQDHKRGAMARREMRRWNGRGGDVLAGWETGGL